MAIPGRDQMKAPPWQLRRTPPEASAWSRSSSARNRLVWVSLVVGLTVVALAGGYALGVSDDDERLNPFAGEPLLVWSNETFSSKREFVGWLVEHGVSYRAWSERHPKAAARLDAHAVLTAGR